MIKSFHQSPNVRKKFGDLGLRNQSWEDQGGHRTLPEMALNGSYKRFSTYHHCDANAYRFEKGYTWWVFFLNLDGPLLDKFILDTIIGWCEMSHLCHLPTCLALSDLIYELKSVNQDRNRCKNGDRLHAGGCQAEGSHHSKLRHCIPHWERKLLPDLVPAATLGLASIDKVLPY